MGSNGFTLDRRSFVKAGGALGAAAAFGSLTGCGGNKASQTYEEANTQATSKPNEEIVWTYCTTDCTQACSLRCHVADGELLYVETDNTGTNEFGDKQQKRACLKGRSLRALLGSPDRLNYPMKRVGKRGEGKFEQISWDEATTMIADELSRVQKTYGPDAVFLMSVWGVNNGIMLSWLPLWRLINMSGGGVSQTIGNYSVGQGASASSHTFGFYNSDATGSGIRNAEFEDGQIILNFGFSPADTRAGGASINTDWVNEREKHNLRIINVDPRHHNSMAGQSDEWVAIRPGTDAALVAGIAHVLIEENLVDIDFLHKSCLGFDEETLPEGAPANSSYYAYIMGTGYDMVEKTPEWAAEATHVPADEIVQLARDLGKASRVYVVQSKGVGRSVNGEQTARSIITLAAMLGQMGLPGTNSGFLNGASRFGLAKFPKGDNPCPTTIQVAMWQNAVRKGKELSGTNGEVIGKEKMDSGIKFIFNYASNVLTNACPDTNGTHELLSDESLVEFIVTSDIMMTDSAKWSDLIIPDLSTQELLNITDSGFTEDVKAAQFGKPVYEPKYDRRDLFEVLCEVAEKMGMGKDFSEGKNREEWLRELWEQSREKIPSLPTWDEGFEAGIYKEDVGAAHVALADYVADPVANPMKTPSGKIEIYSQSLAEIAETWDLPEGESIVPIPVFDPAWDGINDLCDEYPLQLSAFHPCNLTNTTYSNVPAVTNATRLQLVVNPIDAKPRGIETGDTVLVSTKYGKTLIEAKVSNRVIPGTVTMPVGRWHDGSRPDGIDANGCINVLTSPRVTTISKSAPMMSNICQVEKFEE